MKNEQESWADVYSRLATAAGIAWDGCHKIYILSDETSFAGQVDCGYGDGSDESECLRIDSQLEAYGRLHRWWEESCALRFVNAIEDDDEYTRVIPQGADYHWFNDEGINDC